MAKTDLIARCAEILELAPKATIHKHRILALCKRIELVADVIKNHNADTADALYMQVMDTLSATLEDIKEYVSIYVSKNAVLANRIIIYGSDEEQFVKWSERFQHCVASLGWSDKLDGVFSEKDDLQAFEDDMTILRSSIGEILKLLVNSDDTIDLIRLKKTLESLLGHQSTIRSTYQTKTSPTADIEINYKKIKYEHIIGRGGFGVVWKARFKGEYVAIKTIPLPSLTKQSALALKAEANIMRKLAHPRIVACYGLFQHKDNQCIVMELMDSGSLQDYIAEKPCPDGWLKREEIALDICIGMSYLHRLNVIHRDLKPGNVVLNEFLRAKITDFGLSVVKNTAATSIKGSELGTVQYMAPECFGLSPFFSSKSDVYSFAVILWELAHWKFGYSGIKIQEIKDSIRAKERLDISGQLPGLISNLISNCWDSNPKSRPEFGAIAKVLEKDIILLQVLAPSGLVPASTAVHSRSIENTPATNGISAAYDTSDKQVKSGVNIEKHKPPFFQSIYQKRRMLVVLGGITFLALSACITLIIIYLSPQQRNVLEPILNVNTTVSETSIVESTHIFSSSLIDSAITGDNHEATISDGSIEASTYSLTSTILTVAEQETSHTSQSTEILTNVSTTFVVTTTETTFLPTTTVTGILSTSTIVSTIAGNIVLGDTEGYGSAALIGQVYGIAVRASDNTIFFSDYDSGSIKTINSSGYVSSMVSGFTTSIDGPISVARFWKPYGMAADNDTMFVAEFQSGLLRKIENDIVTTIAGNFSSGSAADGTGSAAEFGELVYAYPDGYGNIYTTDSFYRIRRVNSSGTVVTLAGSLGQGNVVGNGNTAQFFSPRGIVYDRATNTIYIADTRNHCIKKMTTEGFVSHLAGSTTRATGFVNAAAASARFRQPSGLVLDFEGNLLISDSGNNCIRKLNLTSLEVTTFAGTGVAGFKNGAANQSTFGYPTALAIDREGSILVGDVDNYAIRKISTVVM